MLEASSIGHAQPKHKTINAEVNLLAEWQRRRTTLHEQIARMAVGSALLLILTCGSVPFLLHMFSQANMRLMSAESTLNTQSGLLDHADQKKIENKPRLDEGTMHDSVNRMAKQFLGQTIQVMNTATPAMALETVKVDVLGGEMTIQCKAQAETNAVAIAFANQADPKQSSTKTFVPSMEKDSLLGTDGVDFEFEKRVNVTP